MVALMPLVVFDVQGHKENTANKGAHAFGQVSELLPWLWFSWLLIYNQFYFVFCNNLSLAYFYVFSIIIYLWVKSVRKKFCESEEKGYDTHPEPAEDSTGSFSTLDCDIR